MNSKSAALQRLPWNTDDPYSFYLQRRRAGTVVWDDTAQAWLVLGYHAARQVLTTPGWSSNPLTASQPVGALGALDPDMYRRFMLFTDGADHTRLRGSVRDVFTPKFIAGLETGIEMLATQIIEHPARAQAFDFMTQVALPLPISVISAWLDLDDTTGHLLEQTSPAIIRLLGALADPDEIAMGASAFAALVIELLPLAAKRRTHPGEDLLSLIASDPELALDDVVVTAILIAVAGHETTANLLGNSMIRLLTPGPDESRLAEYRDPDYPAWVAELLRLDGPVQAAARTATRDHLIDGIEIVSGQQVVVGLAAANRDPDVFEEPDQFRLNRSGPIALAFGYGTHHCIGSALAKLETSIALRHILARAPQLAGEPTWRETPVVRGPKTLPILFDR